MVAVQLDQQLEVVEHPLPEVASNEALIKVSLVGICNTDIELVKGYMGFRGILGHEFVGVVQECAAREWLGKRVVGEINLACHQCEWCHRGLQRHCPNRRVLGILNKDGAMAEYVTLPVSNLHRVPDHVADEAAVFTEPLAAACEIAEQIHLVPGMSALIIGDGKLGLLIAQVLNKYGCEVELLGKHAQKLEIAQQAGVATTARQRKREKYDLVVEATGAGAALPLAIEKVRPRGFLVLKSTYAGQVEIDLAPLVIDEIQLIGSRCGPFAPALKILTREEIDTTALISGRMPLSQAIDGFRLAQQPGVLKVLLDAENRQNR